MSLALNAGSVIAQPGQQIDVASLFKETAGNNPTYVVVALLDRNEYTASSNGETGTLSGDGQTLGLSYLWGDNQTAGIVFTYDATTGQYTNATYGDLSDLVYTASTNSGDSTSLSVFTTENGGLANQYAADPFTLETYAPSSTSYVGSVTVTTQPNFAGPTPAQATPLSLAATAMSFVGQVCNMSGCWVLASNISAEAGASLPLTSTMLGVPGVASGEWIVAYNGPAGQTGNWQSQITAGEIVLFKTSSGSGHITTVVSGSGSSAMVVDNIAFENGNGQITNSANDGAWDIIIGQPHSASYEWGLAVAGSVVVYQLDCPIIKIVTPSSRVAAGGTEQLAPLFLATNPLAGQAITEYQFYDSGTGGAANDSFSVNGSNVFANSAANAFNVSASDLANLSLQAGNSAGVDTISVRAFNGSYWGDWRKFTVNIVAQGPVVSAHTSTQSWQEGQPVDFALAANTFTDPQGEALRYSANLSNGAVLPGWLQFNAATQTFTGSVPSNTAGLSIMVTATNTSGLSTSETFSVQTPAPSSPSLTNPTATQCCADGQVDFTLAPETFTDPSGGTLAYAATLSNGAPLPSWLSFDAKTETFSGLMPDGTKALAINVTATNKNSLSASETFVLSTEQAASQFGQAIAGMTSGTGSSPGSLTFTPAPQEHSTHLANPAHG
jgi:Putative Ig domain